MNAQLKRDYKLMFEIQKTVGFKKYMELDSQLALADYRIENLRSNLSWNIK